MKEIINYTEKVFEDIKHIDEEGNEYWKAKDLMSLLEYHKWENFYKVIKKSMISCKKSNFNVNEQFLEVRKSLIIKVRSKQYIVDFNLTRFACYLIIQNADPRKEAVALAKTYIAMQTRKRELSEKEYYSFTEENVKLNNETKIVIIDGGEPLDNVSLNDISTRFFIMSQADTLLKEKENPSVQDVIDARHKVSETIKSIFKESK